METAKKILIGAAVLVLTYTILFHTPLIINRMDSYSEWVARFHRIEAGNHDSPGFISHESKDELRDDFVGVVRSHQTDLIFGIGGESLSRIQPEELAWRDGTTLYIMNLAPLMGHPKDFEYRRWDKGTDAYLRGQSASIRRDELPIFAFASLYFDKIIFDNTLLNGSHQAKYVLEIDRDF